MAKYQGSHKNDTIKGTNFSDHIHGNKGNDNIYGFGGNDKLYGDEGSDNLFGGTGRNDLWGGGGRGQDNYILTKGASNSDTIHINKGDSKFELKGWGDWKVPINFDRIYNLDKHDKIDLPSSKIMGDIKKYDAPDDINGVFDKFTIKNGVITLQDSHNKTVNIDSIGLAGEAYKFILANCLPKNMDRWVALKVDIDDPFVKENWIDRGDSYGRNSHHYHTVLLEAHTGKNGGESITAIDIIGDVTSTIKSQIIQDSHNY